MARKRNKSSKAKAAESRMPRILVIEGLGGACEAVRAAGASAFEIGTWDVKEADRAFAGDFGEFDGLLLTGGGDVDPRLYGQKPRKETYGVSQTRDLIEWFALDEAAKKGWPVLGICRGSQIMNVHAGGKLKQHINGHRGGSHTVETARGSIIESCFVEDPKDRVTSLHHQMTSKVAEGWSITAKAPDGVTEVVESDDGRCMGVQFHPEMDVWAKYSKAIFDWLADAAAKHAGLKAPVRSDDELWGGDDYYSYNYWHGTGAASTNAKVLDNSASTIARNRAAGTRVFTGGRTGANRPMSITWQCRRGCQARFSRESDRDLHEEAIHGKDGDSWALYDCCWCGSEFASEPSRDKHEACCDMAPKYECWHCDREFDTDDERWEHEMDCSRRSHGGLESMTDDELEELAARATKALEDEGAGVPSS